MSEKEAIVPEEKKEEETERKEEEEKKDEDKKEEEEDELNMPDPVALAQEWVSAGTSWGTSWLSAAKQKTFSTFEMMKKDLSEITDAVSSEAAVITSAAKEGFDVVKQQAAQQAQYLEKLVSPIEEEKEIVPAGENKETKEEQVGKSSSMGFGWMKSLVDTVKTLGMEDTTNGEEQNTEVIRFARKTNLLPARLTELQTSESTFTVAPNDTEKFDAWLLKFHMEEHDWEINQLLSTNPPLRGLFSSLVPTTVDSHTFWARYFFKIEEAEASETITREPFKLQELSVETRAKRASAEGRRLSPEVTREQPTSPARSADDWSICSESKDIEEIPSEGGDESPQGKDDGPLTPRPAEKKDGEWVDWDE